MRRDSSFTRTKGRSIGRFGKKSKCRATAYHRRLGCEFLEDRRLLSGVQTSPLASDSDSSDFAEVRTASGVPLLGALCDTVAFFANESFPDFYARGVKYLAKLSVGVKKFVGVDVYIDLADYYSSKYQVPLSNEGYTGNWVTVWVGGHLGAEFPPVPLPVSIGAIPVEFTTGYEDPARSFELGGGLVDLPTLKVLELSVSDAGFDWDIAKEKVETTLSLADVQLGVTVLRFEVDRETLDNILTTSMVQGIPSFPSVIPEAGFSSPLNAFLSNVIDFSPSWIPFPTLPKFRAFTKSDNVSENIKGALGHTWGGFDVDVDGTPDNYYPVIANALGFPEGAGTLEVTFRNESDAIADYYIEFDIEPAGWYIGAKDQDTATHDNRFELPNIRPSDWGDGTDRWVTTTWSVAAEKWANDSVDITIRLYHDRSFPATDVLLDYRTITLHKFVPSSAKHNEVTIAEAIDRSGSMGGTIAGSTGTKMDRAKEAASQFVGLMGLGDKIGVVSFESSAAVDFSLAEITSTSNAQQLAVNAIQRLSPGGGTSIEAGILAADTQLDRFPNDDPWRAMVLLTDGQAADPTSAILSHVDEDIRIFTIGFGNDADHELLRRIADLRNGHYWPATEVNLNSVYREIVGATGVAGQLLSSSKTIVPGQQLSHNVTVDPSTSELTAGVNWIGSDLDLELIAPDGTIINHDSAGTDPSVELVEESTYEFYKVTLPLPGTWELRVVARDVPVEGEEYNVYALADSPITVQVATSSNTYKVGELVDIELSLNDGAPITGARVEARIDLPQNALFTTARVALFDDGTHGDGEADDGVYAGTFRRACWDGEYLISFDVQGHSNIGFEFSRAPSLPFVVTPALDSDGDAMPDNWEDREGTDKSVNDATLDLEGDGLPNLQEFLQGTMPGNKDTDGDKSSDGQEIAFGTDPLDPSSFLAPLYVTGINATPSGFTVQFNRAIDSTVLNLYGSESDFFGDSDVVVKDSSNKVVPGTLFVIAPDQIQFVASGGVLAAGAYSVTLRSATDGFKDAETGQLLDGDYSGIFPSGDGTPGGNFVYDTFTVGAPKPVVVSLPDFARGPGQRVNIPSYDPNHQPPLDEDLNQAGLPIRLSNANGVTSVMLALKYDPALLTITDVLSGLVPGTRTSDSQFLGSVVYDLSIPGQVSLLFYCAEPLTGSDVTIARLSSDVPLSADSLYGSAGVLHLGSVSINGSTANVTTDDAVGVVAFPGDANASKGYDPPDASLILQAAAAPDTGFAAYPLIDPRIIGDITGNGRITGMDASLVAQKVLNEYEQQLPPPFTPAPYVPVPYIPPLPSASEQKNHAPLLDNSGIVRLALTNEDDTSNSGIPIRDLIANSVKSATDEAPVHLITDPDSGALEGIAIYAVDTSHGSWEFSLDNGVNWSPLGAVSETSARLLASDAATRIRFKPTSNFNGTVDPGVTFRAWDQTTGLLWYSVPLTNGGLADVTKALSETDPVKRTQIPFSTASETAAIRVLPINDKPTADNQSVTTAEDNGVTITFGAGDVETTAGQLIYQITVQPQHGTVGPITGSRVTYTPTGNYNGPDSFQFTVKDDGDPAGSHANPSDLTSDAATVSLTVTPVNDKPTATGQSATTAEESAITITLGGSDLETPAGQLVFAISVPPQHGTLGPITGNQVTYTPNPNYNGPDSFQFTVTDNGDPAVSHANPSDLTSDAATVSLTITPVNDKPTATGQSSTTPEDNAVTITLVGSDVETSAGQLVFAISVQPQHGTLGAITGNQVVYTPNPNYNGPDGFRFTVKDDGDLAGSHANPGDLTSDSATVSLTVTPVNDVPSLGVSPNPGQTPEDTPLAFSVMTDDGDPEFEQQMRLHVVTPPQHGTFSPGFVIQIMDPGMPLVLYYTPAPNYSGPDFFVLAVSDDAQAGPPADLTSPLVTVGVVVTPVNDPPVLAGIEATAVPYTENDPATAITGTITTSDVDNTNLASATVQITGNYQNGQDVLNAPGWTWNPAAGALTLTSSNTLANFQAALRAVKYQNTSESPSAATRTVTFKVNDGAADSNVLTRIITVTPVNDPPTAANGTVTTSKNTERVFGASEFNFSDGDAGDSLSAAQITTLATNGALKWNNGTSWVLVVTNQEIAKADIDAGKLEFVPFANETGSPYATFGFKVKDTGGPTLSTSVYTMTVNVTATLLAAGVAPAGPAETVPLAQADLQPIVNEAIARWAATGLAAQSIDAMAKARFVVTDLPGAQLGLAAGNTIYLDANAAGFGWFVDPTPTKDEEFARIAPEDELRAIGAGVIDRMDLLSVVEHELGHLLGLRDLDSIVPSLMGSSLNKGVRRTVTATEVDAVFATGDFLT